MGASVGPKSVTILRISIGQRYGMTHKLYRELTHVTTAHCHPAAHQVHSPAERVGVESGGGVSVGRSPASKVAAILVISIGRRYGMTNQSHWESTRITTCLPPLCRSLLPHSPADIVGARGGDLSVGALSGPKSATNLGIGVGRRYGMGHKPAALEHQLNATVTHHRSSYVSSPTGLKVPK